MSTLNRVIAGYTDAVLGVDALVATYAIAAVVVIVVVRWLGVLVGLGRPPPAVLSVAAPPEADPAWQPEKQSAATASSAPLSIRDLADPARILCFDPATGFPLGEAKAATPAEVHAAVARARTAQHAYAATTFAERRALLRSILAWTVNNQDLICRVAARDSGKSRIDASFGEVLTTCEKLRWTIEHGEAALRSEFRSPGMIMAHKIPRVEYVPVGVMGCIVSWNYPFHNVFGPVISALMAGNACIVKCSEQVAWSTAFWQSIISAALRAHGISEDLVVFLNGFAETGQALVTSADKITFIGSPGVGKLIMRDAAQTLTPVILELGGKDCAVVFDDCDYAQFRHNAMRYSFQNSGQNCAGLERVIIHEAIHDRFVEDTLKTLTRMRIGSPLLEDIDCGAMTMASQIGIIQSLVDDAVSKGARVRFGGHAIHHPRFPAGQYYSPTLITDVTPTMRIAQEEIFGPVMIVMKFASIDEATSLANSSPFGLGSGVFTLDTAKGEYVARHLRVGSTNVNDFGVNYLCQGLPFGGVGISGVDCFAGVEGLRGNCNPRATTVDRFGFLGIRTNLPPMLRYPIAGIGRRFQETLVELLYALDVSHKGGALVRLAKILIFGHE